MADAPSDYARQISAQISQYASGDEIHDLPAIFDYWFKTHLLAEAIEVSGANSPNEFYASWIIEAQRRSGRNRVVSLGSGDGLVELTVQRRLRELGHDDIVIECLELSPVLIEQGRQAIAEAGLAEAVVMTQVDLNGPPDFGRPAAIVANQSLHHMLTLEDIFGAAAGALAGGGLLLTCDMIGRNGHMRWPETLDIIRRIWPKLPDRLKYHHQLKAFHRSFENWDCSIMGFEGIRSQDILGLLTRTFHIERFFCFGGLSDIFVDRGYGPNFDRALESDRALIDSLFGLERRLLRDGYITPTQTWLVASPEPTGYEARYSLQPTRYVRDPDANPPRVPEALLAAFDVRADEATDALPHLSTERPIDLLAIPDGSFLWGWSSRTSGELTWAIGEESALDIVVEATAGAATSLVLDILGYQRPDRSPAVVTVSLDDVTIGSASFSADGFAEIAFPLVRPDAAPTGRTTLRIKVSQHRRPDVDGGDDMRPLSFLLRGIRLDAAAVAMAAPEPAPADETVAAQ